MIKIQFAQKFVESLGVEVKVVDWDGTLGNYDRDTDTINLNMRRIGLQHKHGKKTNSYEKHLTEYIKLITCHELGHRDDHSERISISQLIEKIDEKNDLKFYLLEDFCDEVKEEIVGASVKREVTAWELGRKYVPVGSEENYDLMNREYIKERMEKSGKMVDEMIEVRRKLVKLNIEKEVYLESNK